MSLWRLHLTGVVRILEAISRGDETAKANIILYEYDANR